LGKGIAFGASQVFALVNVHTRKKKKKKKLKHKEDTWQEFIFSKLFMLGKAPPF
jgi:hypothetical protein